MKKKRRDYPKLNLRISDDMLEWLKDYSKRTGRPMSVIIKDHLQQLQRRDLSQLKKDARL